MNLFDYLSKEIIERVLEVGILLQSPRPNQPLPNKSCVFKAPFKNFESILFILSNKLLAFPQF